MSAEALLDTDLANDLVQSNAMIERDFLAWLPLQVGYGFLFVSVILCVAKPRVGFLFLVFSLFFRFQDRLPEFALLPGFVLQLAALLVGITFYRRQLPIRLARVDKWLLAFAAVSSVGVLLRHTSQFISEIISYTSSLLMFFITCWLITDKTDLRRVMLVMALAISCVGFEAFYAVALQKGPHPFWLVGAAEGKNRLQSIGAFANPNDFGFLLNVGLALWLALFLYTQRFLPRLIYVVLMAMHIYLVTLTLSRNQLLTSVMVMVLSWVLLAKGNAVKKLGGLVVGMAVLLVVLSQVGPVKDRLNTMKSGPDESMEGRFSSWGEGVRMLTDFPVFGWGRQQWLSYHPLGAHNGYIQTIAETGLTGAVTFFGFLVLLIKPLLLFGALPKNKDKKLLVGPLIMLVCLMWCWMLGNVTYSVITYLMFGVVAVVGRLLMEVDASTVLIVKPKFRSAFLQE